MIKDNQKYFNRLHVLLDGIVIAAAYGLAWLIKFKTDFRPPEAGAGILSPSTYFLALIFIVPGYLILNR